MYRIKMHVGNKYHKRLNWEFDLAKKKFGSWIVALHVFFFEKVRYLKVIVYS